MHLEGGNVVPERFYDRTISEKLLYTCFLLLVGLGYLMATAYLYVTHEMNDGKPGLSISDVADSYYGNRSGTRLEAAIRGPMAGYIEEGDRNLLVAWLKDGAGEDHFEKEIKPILQKTCLNCHVASSGMNLPDFSTYEGIHKVAEVDTGMSMASLLKVSHIHLFGISLLLFMLGSIFIQSEVNIWFKRFLVVSPMLAVFVDVASWFLTKWDSHYAIVVIVAGGILGMSMALQILISLFQIWTLKPPASRHGI
ncbi:MAG: hypothetical protein PHH47_09390 [Gallionella sp.]|nr:hypothetical protein [Gallionella sp.]MDD4947662.1 hypothetical protein [Gallionella sp.]MDD5613133.1 hypothetical protein [Gallionella sp.]